ncbi:MAG: MraY family glycosyltransferase [Trueperaceae bacterium]|nr:MraY family glycosyltransferase [Trueperaceae bacterium]
MPRDALILYAPLVLVTFAVAALAVAWAVPRVRTFALRVGAVQEGGAAHGLGVRLHQGRVPNIGGIALFAGFLAAVLVGSVLAPAQIDAYRAQLLAVVLGGALMTLVGFVDDVWEVSAGVRLATQFAAAGILVINGVTIDFITNYFGDVPFVFFPEALAVAVTLLWIVGFTNAFNFIDGLDGLSSGVAAIASLSLLAVALQLPDRGVSVLLLAAVAGSTLAFLRHNSSPATITMGDSGAYFLGYVLAAVSVLGALKVTAAVAVAAPILILALPVVNITQVTLRRLRRRQSPALAANDHLHDLLRERSGSPRIAVYLLWGATLACGVFGMLLAATPLPLVLATIAGSVALLGGLSLWRWREVRRALARA